MIMHRAVPLLLPGLLIAIAGLLIAAPGAGAAEPAADGERLFHEQCAACHTVGGGDRVGPDLEGVTARRDRAWLVRWLLAPDRMLAESDSVAAALLETYRVPMPNLGLTEQDADRLLAYLGGAAAGAAVAPEAAAAGAPAAPAPGDPIAGKGLFTGARPLANGGPPCMACHGVAGIGALGGGALGPDLTAAHAKFGEAGLASILATMPFPTMRPIFGRRPLTREEQGDLAAFLRQSAVAGRAPRAVAVLALLSAAGAAVLLALASVVWRRRLAGVRRSLVTRGSRG